MVDRARRACGVGVGGVGNQNIKDELKKRTQEAFEKGVFGAPTFLVNNKIFWGQDRIEFALKESLK